jgi:hypothetical protein
MTGSNLGLPSRVERLLPPSSTKCRARIDIGMEIIEMSVFTIGYCDTASHPGVTLAPDFIAEM